MGMSWGWVSGGGGVGVGVGIWELLGDGSRVGLGLGWISGGDGGCIMALGLGVFWIEKKLG
ncbi:unnamed protein product [Prunus armeniaca]